MWFEYLQLPRLCRSELSEAKAVALIALLPLFFYNENPLGFFFSSWGIMTQITT
jgi:hypothetical protein